MSGLLACSGTVAVDYSFREGRLLRSLSVGGRRFDSERMDLSGRGDGWDRWWLSFLRDETRPVYSGPPVRVLDLFCSIGGFRAGFDEAAGAVGLSTETVMAVDADRRRLETYGRLFDTSRLAAVKVEEWDPAGVPADVVLAGPPCEGFSLLNKKTRFADERNGLVSYVVSTVEMSGARAVLIENVPSVLRDPAGAFRSAVVALQEAGFKVTWGVLAADQVGWPQTRHRCFVAACRDGVVPLEEVAQVFARPARPVGWAIADLLDVEPKDRWDEPAALSRLNRRRIDAMFDSGTYQLPWELKPESHRMSDRFESRSIGGRLFWDRPAGTITSGFTTVCRGRNVHPLRRRTLTLHEAARLQSLPDWLRFPEVSREDAAKWIADAVPSYLGFVAAFCVLPYLARELP